jgi:uncharacterized protein
LVAEVLHGAPCRFSDPARFSLAHGGKDRHPFPVPIKVYDETICVLRSAVDRAKLGRDDALFALRKLDAESRRLERVANGPAFRLGAALGGSSRATQRARAKVKTPIPSSVGGGQPPMR